MIYVGIDPSIRHTGICILDDAGSFITSYEFRTEANVPLVDAGISMRDDFKLLVTQNFGATFGMEKMVPGARCGPQLFYIQMLFLEVLQESHQRRLVHPYPVQLHSYVKARMGAVPANGTEVVAMFKKDSGVEGRYSTHIADAYFLAKMAREVALDQWAYNKSAVELKLISWDVMHGKPNPRVAAQA